MQIVFTARFFVAAVLFLLLVLDLVFMIMYRKKAEILLKTLSFWIMNLVAICLLVVSVCL